MTIFATDASIDNRDRDFCQVVGQYATDGLTNASEIAQLFGDKCCPLNSSVSYEQTEIKRNYDRIDFRWSSMLFIWLFVTASDDQDALSKLKRDRDDVNNLLYSDHFIYTQVTIYLHILPYYLLHTIAWSPSIVINEECFHILSCSAFILMSC